MPALSFIDPERPDLPDQGDRLLSDVQLILSVVLTTISTEAPIDKALNCRGAGHPQDDHDDVRAALQADHFIDLRRPANHRIREVHTQKTC